MTETNNDLPTSFMGGIGTPKIKKSKRQGVGAGTESHLCNGNYFLQSPDPSGLRGLSYSPVELAKSPSSGDTVTEDQLVV